MKGAKVKARRERRQKAWDSLFAGKPGFRRPGSNKKPFPRGKR